MNVYKEEIYKNAMEKEAIWGALAGLAARALPAISSATGKALASNAVKTMATKEVAKSIGKDMLVGGALGGSIGALANPEDRAGGAVKGALGGAAGFGALGAGQMAGKKLLIPALANSAVGKRIVESNVGKYVAKSPKLTGAVKGAIPDAAVFGTLGALPTKGNDEQYGEGIEGRIKGAISGAALGGAMGGAFGALGAKRKAIQPIHY